MTSLPHHIVVFYLKYSLGFSESTLPYFTESLSIYDDIDADVLRNYQEFTLANILYYSLKESTTSEQSARMTAMDNASKNACESAAWVIQDFNCWPPFSQFFASKMIRSEPASLLITTWVMLCELILLLFFLEHVNLILSLERRIAVNFLENKTRWLKANLMFFLNKNMKYSTNLVAGLRISKFIL